MPRSTHNRDNVTSNIRALLARLDVHMDNVALITQALTHRSWAFENGLAETNERLEFLGDAVVGLVVTDRLYVSFPEEAEGVLAKLRSAAVRSETLAQIARDLAIGDAVLLGHGETKSHGADKDSILADTFEAVIGAIYLDQGFASAYDVVERLFDPLLPTLADQGVALDFKTNLQELAAKRFGELPLYTVQSDGPEHEKQFIAQVWLYETLYGTGTAASKKQAEQQAAMAAYHRIAASPLPHERGDAD